jgi:hypothetical protein
LEAIESWSLLLDEGYGVDIVYLDFRKAFDTVPHKKLLLKMKCFGICDQLITWISSFLSGRTMRVMINGVGSAWYEVLSGVPQGSVIGPLLFLLFVQDLPDWVMVSILMFADDTKLWSKISHATDSHVLQKALDKLVEWANLWGMRFNIEKCKVMHVGHEMQTIYRMRDNDQDCTLQTVDEERDLGVIVSKDLKSAKQCKKAAGKANAVLGMVRRQFQSMNKQAFLILYKGYVRPHLEYCIQAWNPHLVQDIEVMEKVQKRATKLVQGLGRLSYERRLQILGLTSLRKRRERGDLIEVYKLLHGVEKIDPEKFFSVRQASYHLRGHRFTLEQHRYRLAVRQHTFSQRIVPTWNQLPEMVVNAESVNSFKNCLDAWIEKQALKAD